MEPESSLSCPVEPATNTYLEPDATSRQLHTLFPSFHPRQGLTSTKSFVTFRNKLFFLRWGLVGPSPKLQTGGSLLVGCPRLLIQYIYMKVWHLVLNTENNVSGNSSDNEVTWLLMTGVKFRAVMFISTATVSRPVLGPTEIVLWAHYILFLRRS
jgi:hypothetical protein